jgi:hypothetical protein
MTQTLVDKEGVIEQMKATKTVEPVKEDVEMQEETKVDDTNYKTLLQAHDQQVQTMHE